MKIDTDDMVSVTEVNSRGFSWLIGEAAAGRNMLVLKNNAPAAVVVSPEVAGRLQALEGMEEDLRLLALTLIRMATDSGERIDVRDLAKELGVDPDDDDQDDES